MLGKSRRQAHVLFTLPILIIFAVFFFAPLILGIFFSFTDWNGIADRYNLIGLGNYIRVFKTPKVLSAVKFTLKYALLLSSFTTLLSLGLSLLLNKDFRGKTFVRSVYFLPAILGSIVIGLIFNEIYYRVLPPLGKELGIAWLSKSLVSSSKTAIFSVLIANLWQALAIPTTLLIAGLQSIPLEMYESAAIDGANSVQRFKSITMPYLMPSITIVLVLALKDGLMVFDYIMAITNRGPAGSTESISTMIYYMAFQLFDYSYASAASVLLFVIIAIFGLGQIKIMSRMEAQE